MRNGEPENRREGEGGFSDSPFLRFSVSLKIFLFGLCLTLALRGLQPESIDELLPLHAAVSVVERGDLDIPVTDIFHPQFFVMSADGRYYPKFGPGQSVILAPFVAAGKAAAAVLNAAPERHAGIILSAALFFGPVTVSIMAVMMFRLWQSLGYSASVSALSAVLFLSTSELLPYSRTLFGNLSCAALLLGALLSIGTFRESSVWRAAAAGVCLGASVLVRPDTLLLLAPFSLYVALVWKRESIGASARRRQLMVMLASLAVLFTAWFLFNHHAYGSPFSTGYKSEVSGFDQDFLPGAAHILFSWEKGFFVYSPSVLLSLFFWRRFHNSHSAESYTALLFMAVSLYIYAIWYASSPGYDLSYGQRFLLPAVPFAYLALPECLSALRRGLPKLLAGSVFVVSLSVQLIGCLQRGADYRRWAAQFENFPPRFAGYLRLSLDDPSTISIWWVEQGGVAVFTGIVLFLLAAFWAWRSISAGPKLCLASKEIA